ncbi:S8 family serine peptidase [Actinoplanes sp. NPDC049596]|uniref:S8 family serine peptidase n=1 Tax=unclassified Actinoplanes TaxID=2626549 RepID=UPI0034369920
MSLRNLRAGAATVAGLTAAVLTGPAVGAAPPAVGTPAAPAGEVLVVLKDRLTALPPDAGHEGRRRSSATSQQDAVGKRAGITGAVTHLTVGNAFLATVTPAQVAALGSDPDVARIVPAATRIATAPVHPRGDSGPATGRRHPLVTPRPGRDASSALCPTDPSQPLLEPEGLTAIHAVGTDGAVGAQQLADGSGVKVAVMAEGLDPAAPDYRRADGSSAIVDYQDFSGAPVAESGHAYGEEIYGDASTITAQGNVVHDLSTFVNATHPLPSGCTIQIRGVAPGADVVALKVLDGGPQGTYTTIGSVVQAIDYAVTVAHVDIISESIGAASYPDAGTANAVQAFNDEAVAAGVTVIAAGGDAGATGTIGSPAADPLVISAAGSTTQRLAMQTAMAGTTLSNGHWVNGNIGAFSSGGITQSGTVPTLTAPADAGWAACSPDISVPGCTSLNGDPAAPAPSDIEVFGGTSMAAPFIAGTAALVIQAYRRAHHASSPAPALVRQILTSSSDDLGAPADQQGSGQVNALAATRLAMRAGHPDKPGAASGDGVLLSASQLTVTAAPGQTATSRVTVSNPGSRAVVLHPGLRRLEPMAPAEQSTVSLDPDTDPTFAGPRGETDSYRRVPFTVGPHTDHVAVAIAYHSTDAIGFNGAAFGIPTPQVSVTLLDPSGAYVISSRPQGGTTAGNYGNVDLARPRPGRWTAVLSTTPAIGSLLGVPLTVPAFKGDVHFSVRQERWTRAGTASPATLVLPPGASSTVVAHSTLPSTGGDSTAELTFGAGRPVVPEVQRALVPVTARGGRFSGTVTGGNGRGLQAAQTTTYAFDVPAGHRDLDVSTVFSATGTPAAMIALIAPNGQIASAQNNIGADLAKDTFLSGNAVQNYVAKPQSGRWRLVVVIGQPVPGDAVSSAFTGIITFDKVAVDAADLPHQRTTVLPGGKPTTVHINLENTGSTTLSAYADARTAVVGTVNLGVASQTLPVDESGFLLAPRFRVPPQTTELSGTVSAELPVMAQMDGPTAGLLLSAPSAVGPATSGSGQSSTAVVDGAGGFVSAGDWGLQTAQVGPYGSAGAPTGSSTITMSATTPGFDTSVTASTGDPYQPPALTTGPPPGTPSVIQPGAQAGIDVTITPSAPAGTVVRGHLNIVTAADASLLTKIEDATPPATGQLLAVIPYEYTVGAAASR